MKEGTQIALILRRNCLLKHVTEGKIERGREDEEGGVSSYWMILRKKRRCSSLKEGTQIAQIMRRNCLLKHVTEGKIERGREDEEGDVSSYWMTLRKKRRSSSLKEGTQIAQILRRNCLLKHVTKGKIEGGRKDEEGDVSSYWMTLRKNRRSLSLKEGAQIAQILRRNCLLKHVTEGKIEKGREDEEGDVSSYWMILRKKRRCSSLKEGTQIAQILRRNCLLKHVT